MKKNKERKRNAVLAIVSCDGIDVNVRCRTRLVHGRFLISLSMSRGAVTPLKLLADRLKTSK